MQALLVLYMTSQLLHGGHIENVVGFGPFRHALEGVFGPMSPQALASPVRAGFSVLAILLIPQRPGTHAGGQPAT